MKLYGGELTVTNLNITYALSHICECPVDYLLPIYIFTYIFSFKHARLKRDS